MLGCEKCAAIREKLLRLCAGCKRHCFGLAFAGLLCAVLLACVWELPPLLRQEGIAPRMTKNSEVKAMLHRPDKININTAVEAELTCLTGIGPAKANAILAYREEHGAFQNVQELDQVAGISKKILLQIEQQITVS